MQQVNIRIVATANTARARTEIRALNAAVSDMQRAVSRGINVIGAQSKYATTPLTKIPDRFDEITRAVERGKISMSQYREGIRNTSKLIQRQAQLQRSVLVSGNTGQQRMGTIVSPQFVSGMDTAMNKMAMFNTLTRAASNQLIDWGKNQQWAGRQIMAGFTMPMGMAAAAAAKFAYDVDVEMVKFRKVFNEGFGTSVDEAAERIDALGEKLVETLGRAKKETIDVAAAWAQMGKGIEEAEFLTEETMRLSTLGDVDVESSINLVRSLTATFSLAGEELTDAINVINTVENNTSMAAADLAGNFQQIAPVFEQFNVPIENALAMLAAMKERLGNVNEATNALKVVMYRILDPTDEAADAFGDLLGINIDDLRQTANTDGIEAYMSELGDIIRKGRLEVTDFAETFGNLFGLRQAGRALTAVEAISEQNDAWAAGEGAINDYGRALEATGDAQKNAADAAKELNEILESDSGSLRVAVQNLLNEIAELGEPILAMASDVVDSITRIFEWFNNLSTGVKTTFATIITVISGIGLGKMIIGIFANAFGSITRIVSAALPSMSVFTSSTWGAKQAMDGLGMEVQDVMLEMVQQQQVLRQTHAEMNRLQIESTEGTAEWLRYKTAVNATQTQLQRLDAQMSKVASKGPMVRGSIRGAMIGIAGAGLSIQSIAQSGFGLGNVLGLVTSLAFELPNLTILLRSMWTAMLGPVGLVAAIATLAGGLIFWKKKTDDAKMANAGLKSSIDDLADSGIELSKSNGAVNESLSELVDGSEEAVNKIKTIVDTAKLNSSAVAELGLGTGSAQQRELSMIFTVAARGDLNEEELKELVRAVNEDYDLDINVNDPDGILRQLFDAAGGTTGFVDNLLSTYAGDGLDGLFQSFRWWFTDGLESAGVGVANDIAAQYLSVLDQFGPASADALLQQLEAGLRRRGADDAQVSMMLDEVARTAAVDIDNIVGMETVETIEDLRDLMVRFSDNSINRGVTKEMSDFLDNASNDLLGFLLDQTGEEFTTEMLEANWDSEELKRRIIDNIKASGMQFSDERIKDFISGAREMPAEIVAVVEDTIARYGSEATNGMISATDVELPFVREAAAGMQSDIARVMLRQATRLAEKIREGLTSQTMSLRFAEQLSDAGGDLWPDEITDSVADIPGAIDDGLGDVADEIENVGSNVRSAFESAWSDYLDDVRDAIDEQHEAAMENYEEEVKAIEERREEEKAASDERIDALDTQLELLQKMRDETQTSLDYRAAIARGDLGAAAEAQQGLLFGDIESQIQDAQDAISDEDARREQIADAEIERINREKDARDEAHDRRMDQLDEMFSKMEQDVKASPTWWAGAGERIGDVLRQLGIKATNVTEMAGRTGAQAYEEAIQSLRDEASMDKYWESIGAQARWHFLRGANDDSNDDSSTPPDVPDTDNGGGNNNVRSTPTGGGGTSRSFFHSGGGIKGGTKADVPIVAQEGEFMIQRDAAKALGEDQLHMLNNAHKYHVGGMVQAGAKAMGSNLPSMLANKMSKFFDPEPHNIPGIGVDRSKQMTGLLQPPDADRTWRYDNWLYNTQGYAARMFANSLARLEGPQLITSAYRSPAVQRALGGVPNSDHVKGKGFDFVSGTGNSVSKFDAMGRWFEGQPGVRWVGRPGTDPSGGHNDHVHVSYKHSGGPIGLAKGGKVLKNDVLANLHKDEQVLRAPVSRAMERNLINGTQSNTVNIKVENMTGEEKDIKRLASAVGYELSRMDQRKSRSRVLS